MKGGLFALFPISVVMKTTIGGVKNRYGRHVASGIFPL